MVLAFLSGGIQKNKHTVILQNVMLQYCKLSDFLWIFKAFCFIGIVLLCYD